jgi:hypothetical protein
LFFRFIICFVSFTNAQSSSLFASGEGERVYNLLDGLGCIGNTKCTQLRDFTSSTACNYKPQEMKCDSSGKLSFL